MTNGARFGAATATCPPEWLKGIQWGDIAWLKAQKARREVRVAILDSGVDAFVDILRNRVVEQWVVPPGKETCYQLDTGTQDRSYSSPHGTAVASVIAGMTEGRDNIKLVSVKVIPDTPLPGVGGLELFIKGLEKALPLNVDVVNISLAIDPRRTGFLRHNIQALCEKAYYQDVILVASRSNMKTLKTIPAEFSSVVGVDIAQNKPDDPWHYGIRQNNTTEFTAWGEDVPVVVPGGEKEFRIGTSYATPHITAICAHICSIFPGIRPHEVKSVLAHFASRSKEDGP